MDPATRLRLEDMLEYARIALAVLGEADVSALSANTEKRLAVAKAVEIIGEAANAIDPALRRAMPGLPWPQMIAMRNRLVHGYGQVDLNILTDTVRNGLPSLIAEIERLLNANP